MNSESTISGRGSKASFNIAVALLLTLLAAWITWADFSHPGDLLFQSSPSVMVTALVTSLLFLLGIIIAALPKRIIVGANLLILSRVALGFPLNVWLETSLAARIISVAFLILAFTYLCMSLGGMQWISARPWLKPLHSVIAFAAWLFFGIITLPVWLAGYAYGAQNLIGDYAGISTKGIDLTEKIFEKNGRKVHLVGMMHIGDDSYYTGLKERVNAIPEAGGKRLVLTEGVSDRNNVIPEDFANGKTYERWAKLLGIEAQKELNTTTPSPPTIPIPNASTPAPDEPTTNPLVTWQNADIDVSDLKPDHLQLLVKLLDVASSPDFTKMVNPDVGNVTGAQLESLFKDALIGTRNDALMKQYTERAEGFQEVYIPWGAAHLPDMEKRLLALGYLQTDEIIRPIIKFWK